jgi:hypothetical protein
MDIGRMIHELRCNFGDWRMFLQQSTNNKVANTEIANGREPNGDSYNDLNQDLDQDHSAEDHLSKNKLCQDLEKHGLLRLLSSGEPEQLGFSFEWYRRSS